LNKTELGGKFTFTTFITGEAFEATFDEEPDVVHKYQDAMIARNDDKYYFLDVVNLSEELEAGKYYSVTGELNGSVYWTEDNKKINVLDITAKEAKSFAPEDKSEDTNVLVNGDYEYAFVGAHFAEAAARTDVIVVYFEFTNNSGKEASPSLSAMDFYQGDGTKSLYSTVLTVKELDGSAINVSAPGISGKETYAGKTGFYCAALQIDKDAKENKDVLWAVRYNDDYELIDDIGINVFKDLKALQKVWEE